MPNKKGYHYLLGVVSLAFSGEVKNLKQAYSAVAKRHGVKLSAVEKGISGVIEKSFEAISVAEKYGGIVDKEKGKLTNKQFVELVISSIKNS